ncbi:hypothetical protein OC835_005413 [Tilletia horrida]|nr:hypothetical protein OC835_005413 [Tilletia horrida]
MNAVVDAVLGELAIDGDVGSRLPGALNAALRKYHASIEASDARSKKFNNSEPDEDEDEEQAQQNVDQAYCNYVWRLLCQRIPTLRVALAASDPMLTSKASKKQAGKAKAKTKSKSKSKPKGRSNRGEDMSDDDDDDDDEDDGFDADFIEEDDIQAAREGTIDKGGDDDDEYNEDEDTQRSKGKPTPKPKPKSKAKPATIRVDTNVPGTQLLTFLDPSDWHGLALADLCAKYAPKHVRVICPAEHIQAAIAPGRVHEVYQPIAWTCLQLVARSREKGVPGSVIIEQLDVAGRASFYIIKQLLDLDLVTKFSTRETRLSSTVIVHNKFLHECVYYQRRLQSQLSLAGQSSTTTHARADDASETASIHPSSPPAQSSAHAKDKDKQHVPDEELTLLARQALTLFDSTREPTYHEVWVTPRQANAPGNRVVQRHPFRAPHTTDEQNGTSQDGKAAHDGEDDDDVSETGNYEEEVQERAGPETEEQAQEMANADADADVEAEKEDENEDKAEAKQNEEGQPMAGPSSSPHSHDSADASTALHPGTRAVGPRIVYKSRKIGYYAYPVLPRGTYEQVSIFRREELQRRILYLLSLAPMGAMTKTHLGTRMGVPIGDSKVQRTLFIRDVYSMWNRLGVIEPVTISYFAQYRTRRKRRPDVVPDGEAEGEGEEKERGGEGEGQGQDQDGGDGEVVKDDELYRTATRAQYQCWRITERGREMLRETESVQLPQDAELRRQLKSVTSSVLTNEVTFERLQMEIIRAADADGIIKKDLVEALCADRSFSRYYDRLTHFLDNPEPTPCADLALLTLLDRSAGSAMQDTVRFFTCATLLRRSVREGVNLWTGRRALQPEDIDSAGGSAPGVGVGGWIKLCGEQHWAGMGGNVRQRWDCVALAMLGRKRLSRQRSFMSMSADRSLTMQQEAIPAPSQGRRGRPPKRKAEEKPEEEDAQVQEPLPPTMKRLKNGTLKVLKHPQAAARRKAKLAAEEAARRAAQELRLGIATEATPVAPAVAALPVSTTATTMSGASVSAAAALGGPPPPIGSHAIATAGPSGAPILPVSTGLPQMPYPQAPSSVPPALQVQPASSTPAPPPPAPFMSVQSYSGPSVLAAQPPAFAPQMVVNAQTESAPAETLAVPASQVTTAPRSSMSAASGEPTPAAAEEDSRRKSTKRVRIELAHESAPASSSDAAAAAAGAASTSGSSSQAQDRGTSAPATRVEAEPSVAVKAGSRRPGTKPKLPPRLSLWELRREAAIVNCLREYTHGCVRDDEFRGMFAEYIAPLPAETHGQLKPLGQYFRMRHDIVRRSEQLDMAYVSVPDPETGRPGQVAVIYLTSLNPDELQRALRRLQEGESEEEEEMMVQGDAATAGDGGDAGAEVSTDGTAVQRISRKRWQTSPWAHKVSVIEAPDSELTIRTSSRRECEPRHVRVKHRLERARLRAERRAMRELKRQERETKRERKDYWNSTWERISAVHTFTDHQRAWLQWSIGAAAHRYVFQLASGKHMNVEQLMRKRIEHALSTPDDQLVQPPKQQRRSRAEVAKVPIKKRTSRRKKGRDAGGIQSKTRERRSLDAQLFQGDSSTTAYHEALAQQGGKLKRRSRHAHPRQFELDELTRDVGVILTCRDRERENGRTNWAAVRQIGVENIMVFKKRWLHLKSFPAEDAYLRKLEMAWWELWHKERGSERLPDHDPAHPTDFDLRAHLDFFRQNIDKNKVTSMSMPIDNERMASTLPLSEWVDEEGRPTRLYDDLYVLEATCVQGNRLKSLLGWPFALGLPSVLDDKLGVGPSLGPEPDQGPEAGRGEVEAVSERALGLALATVKVLLHSRDEPYSARIVPFLAHQVGREPISAALEYLLSKSIIRPAHSEGRLLPVLNFDFSQEYLSALDGLGPSYPGEDFVRQARDVIDKLNAGSSVKIDAGAEGEDVGALLQLVSEGKIELEMDSTELLNMQSELPITEVNARDVVDVDVGVTISPALCAHTTLDAESLPVAKLKWDDLVPAWAYWLGRQEGGANEEIEAREQELLRETGRPHLQLLHLLQIVKRAGEEGLPKAELLKEMAQRCSTADLCEGVRLATGSARPVLFWAGYDTARLVSSRFARAWALPCPKIVAVQPFEELEELEREQGAEEVGGEDAGSPDGGAAQVEDDDEEDGAIEGLEKEKQAPAHELVLPVPKGVECDPGRFFVPRAWSDQMGAVRAERRKTCFNALLTDCKYRPGNNLAQLRHLFHLPLDRLDVLDLVRLMLRAGLVEARFGEGWRGEEALLLAPTDAEVVLVPLGKVWWEEEEGEGEAG